MTLKRLSVFLSCFMFAGCWFSSHPVPMPLNESQFSKPIEKPFKLSGTNKIKGRDVPADSNKSKLNNNATLLSPRVNRLDILVKDQYFICPGLNVNTDTVWSENKDSFYLNGLKEKGIEWESLSAINMPIGLSLPHDQNYLRFHFGNYLPQYAGDYQYQYILDGVDEKWSPVTDLPISENYNSIPPGHYTFRVSVKKGNGNWSTPSEFHFRIRPPWWFSWWAELIYFIIFIGLVRLWIRYRSLRLLHENAWLEQKVAERTEALSQSLENLRALQQL